MSAFSLERKAETLATVFQDYKGPAFAVRLWDDWTWHSSRRDAPQCAIVLKNAAALRKLVAAPNEITLGEAFIRGDLEVEGDLFSVFSVAEHVFKRHKGLPQRAIERLANTTFSLRQWLRHGPLHSQRRDRASIACHYDQPVDFYRPWLGPSMAYSCAYFKDPTDSLTRAQEQKLDLILRKLRLQHGERFLDIGCGWGSLVLEAAAREAVAHGITLSREQCHTAQQRIRAAGSGDSCSVELRDIRRMEETGLQFDKIASVGMYEHVGLRNLSAYFGIAYRLLKPGGLFLNHGIARNSRVPPKRSSFIARHVFPDGRLVTLSETLAAAESSGFEVRDVECLREHYEITLRCWVEALKQHAPELLRLVPVETYRLWLLYMAGSAAAFRRGDIGVYQVLLSKPDHGKSHLPLTREDLYRVPERREGMAV